MQIAYKLIIDSKNKPIIFIAQDVSRAMKIYKNICFLLRGNRSIYILIPDEKIPYQMTTSDLYTKMELLATLQKLAQEQFYRIIITIPAMLIAKVLPRNILQENLHCLSIGSLVNHDHLLKNFINLGYFKVKKVEEPGTFLIRGSTIEFFWIGYDNPIRIDFVGNLVKNICFYDRITQRKTYEIDNCCFGLVRDIIFSDQNIARAINCLQSLADELDFPTEKLRSLIINLKNKLYFFGIENYFPIFYEKLESIFDFFIESDWFLEEKIDLQNALSLINENFEKNYKNYFIKKELIFAPDWFLNKIPSVKKIKKINISKTSKEIKRFFNKELKFSTIHKEINRLHKEKISVLFPVSSPDAIERYTKLLSLDNIRIRNLKNNIDFFTEFLFNKRIDVYFFIATPNVPETSAIFNNFKYAIFSENELCGTEINKQITKSNNGIDLQDLSKGNLIVHAEFGVGKFEGLERTSVLGVEQDFILISYAGLRNEKLYIPICGIGEIKSNLGIDDDNLLGAGIHKFCGKNWRTLKKKIEQEIFAVAHDLLNLYAKRQLIKRIPFYLNRDLYSKFEHEFPFEITDDQKKAIDDIISDMLSEKPMDRLICGDAGYGKTEISMRAAMISFMNRRSVVILVPTTILAQQHGFSFKERFKNTEAKIKVVSRLQSVSEIDDIKREFHSKQIDIIIGTSRILSGDFNFSNIGLVIIDEEQRLGIEDKEWLKKLSTSVDVLMLSATPIPRTLQMSVLGIRDLNTIETRPVDRKAITTTIIRFDEEIIRSKISEEIERGGQVYFVHNCINTLSSYVKFLKKLVPKARIEMAHGRMHKNKLEEVMLLFNEKKIDMLVCTTIIEIGIDIPTVNTIFIDDADNFGLSQLYQLRGRIGRGKEHAFAYLIVSNEKNITPAAKLRLDALQRFNESGAGMQIAQRDLQLRGAGNFLGKKQHGKIAMIGYNLYFDLLKNAVQAIRGSGCENASEPRIEIPFSMRISENYISDLNDRMTVYRQLMTAENDQQLDEILENLKKQYGPPPSEVYILRRVSILKKILKQLAIEFFTIKNNNLVFSLKNSTMLNSLQLIQLVKENNFKLTPDMNLYVSLNNKSNWFELSKEVLSHLIKCIIL